MKRSNRIAWLGAIALSVIILVSLFAAPNTKLYSGSTYSRTADGYGAWYAFMQEEKVNIERWQKSINEITAEKNPVTLLRVSSTPREPSLFFDEQKWVDKGNTLVILGVKTPVTEADFYTQQESAFGEIKIATRRRDQKAEKISLGDRFGAIVWEEKSEKGKVIFANTPYLAANAYQDNLSNFQYLKNLVSPKNNKLLVDEYIHGYKDANVRKAEGQGDIFSYLSQTPLLPALTQVGVLLLVLIWAKNRRFGKPVGLDTPVVNNSEAYIQALAGVLQKAASTDFVVEMIGKEEQLQLQKALGLGTILVERQALLQLWQEKTGTSAAELETVLKIKERKQRMSERELLNWLVKWRNLKEIQNSK